VQYLCIYNQTNCDKSIKLHCDIIIDKQWRSQGVVLGVQTPLGLKKKCFYCMILILLFLLLFNIILVFSMYGCGTLFGDRRELIAPTTKRSHIYSELYKHMYMSMAVCMTRRQRRVILFYLCFYQLFFYTIYYRAAERLSLDYILL